MWIYVAANKSRKKLLFSISKIHRRLMKMPFPLPAKHSNWHFGKKCELIDSKHAISGHVITGRRGLTNMFLEGSYFQFEISGSVFRLSVGFAAV
jgi:hypothetical protein